MQLLQMKDVDLTNKRVLIREDFNTPIEDNKITSDNRIRMALPTIKAALEQNAAVILMSHLGRPKQGELDKCYSLSLAAERLSELLEQPVRLEPDWQAGIEIQPGDVVLCENVRLDPGETKNDEALAKTMAALCDIFVMDAFASAHRAHASTHGVIRFAPVACAGPLFLKELTVLKQVFEKAKRPVLAIVGGAKISTKFAVLKSLSEKVDKLIVGGGIANTFIAAKGFSVGKSLYEKELLVETKELIDHAQSTGCDIPMLKDAVVAKQCKADTLTDVVSIEKIADDDMILDIGPKTSQYYQTLIQQAATIIWSGPVGVFELSPFSQGTHDIAKCIANHDAFSVAGGGDTIAALDKFNCSDKMSYISTGGSAFLEFIEGKTLPSIAVLQQRANINVEN